MKIIYIIDFNCPYSYIGLERLKKATENLNMNNEWEFKAYELEPLTGKRPEKNTAERYAERFEITLKEASDKISEIEQIAHDDGLEINYMDMLFTNSKDALRLCKYCQNTHPEITLKLVEEIFYANLVKNENIADTKILSEIAISTGLKENEVNRILENNYYNIEIYLDQEDAISHGILSTPYFILETPEERLYIAEIYTADEFETVLKDLI